MRLTGMLILLIVLFSPPAFADDEADVAAALDALHKAEREGDLEKFLNAFAAEGIFLGTDASEAWTVEDLRRDLGERFATKGGWTFEINERAIGVSDDGRAAWFKEIVHYVRSDYILRPTGTMIKRDGRWQIAQLHMGIPIPNQMFPPLLQAFHAQAAGPEAEKAAIGAVLDTLHLAASVADGDAYFSLFTEDSSFIGTDISEFWPIAEFRDYAMARFDTGVGWTYQVRDRQIDLGPHSNMAWFHEILWNENYGTTRGTGVLVREDDAWKIAQYHLTIPIPNDLAAGMAAEIKAFEGK